MNNVFSYRCLLHKCLDFYILICVVSVTTHCMLSILKIFVAISHSLLSPFSDYLIFWVFKLLRLICCHVTGILGINGDINTCVQFAVFTKIQNGISKIQIKSCLTPVWKSSVAPYKLNLKPKLFNMTPHQSHSH